MADGLYGSVVPPPYVAQTTPYPQTTGFGIGSAMNNFAANLLAARLYQTQQERANRFEALQKLGLLEKFGAQGLRTPQAGGLAEQAGMPLGVFQAPGETLEEIKTRQAQQQAGFFETGLANMEREFPGLAGIYRIDPEMARTIAKEQLSQASFQRFMQLAGGMGAEGGGEVAAPPADLGIPGSRRFPQGPQLAQPTAPPTGRRPSVPPTVTTEIGYGPQGGTVKRTVKQGDVPAALLQDERTQAILAEAAAYVEENISPESLKAWSKATGTPEDIIKDAVINDHARRQGANLDHNNYPGRMDILREGRANQIAKATEERLRQGEAQLQINLDRLELSNKQFQELIRQNNLADAAKLRGDMARYYHETRASLQQNVIRPYLELKRNLNVSAEELAADPKYAELLAIDKKLDDDYRAMMGMPSTATGIMPTINPRFLNPKGGAK